MLIAFIVICVIFLLGSLVWALWFTSPKQIGIRGERKVNSVLHECEGTLYEDYVLVDENGKSHQIDSILVNNNGVFVIETKHYSGRIYGSDTQDKWTQVLKYGKVKNHFYSPVKQNNGHLYQLGQILPRGTKFVPLVVFARNNADFVKSDVTINLKSLKKVINNTHNQMSDDLVNEINDCLLKNRNIEITNKEHVKNIRQTKKDIKNNICPRCGGKLVLRHGKNGDFYGCSNYPKCRYIKK